MLSIGLMSGTSMDGIDAALLKTDGAFSILELGDVSFTYPRAVRFLLKAGEYAIRTCKGDMLQAASYYEQALQDFLTQELHLSSSEVQAILKEVLSYMGTQYPLSLDGIIQLSTDLHGQVVHQLLEKTGYKSQDINVVGYHGQAMFHQPAQGISIIVGNGQNLANQLGICVVSDFRSCDIKAGGQGAPFAPIYHQALALRDSKIPLVVVNCGGIANVTLIQNENELDLLGFDTGPGNGLIDRLIRKRTRGQEHMDKDGQYGSNGNVDSKAFAALYEKSILKNGQNYFEIMPPKALDIGDMHLVDELMPLSLEDACRTLEAFTADTIVQSMKLIKREIPQSWILVGGGWNNPVILQGLKQRLVQAIGNSVNVMLADQVGWNSQAKEAQIFAYLAVRSIKNRPLSFPGTTGVPYPVSGGTQHIPYNFG